jgi:predicted nuclease with TOPRIM domain
MADTDKLLQTLERLESGQKAVQEDVSAIKVEVAKIPALQEGVKSLKEGQQTLELKVEVFHSEQRRANAEIIGTLHDIGEVNARDTEKRLARIEKHLNLPSLK